MDAKELMQAIRNEIEKRIKNINAFRARGELLELLSFLDALPEQPKIKPKAIVIRPVVNLQKELMGVSAEVKNAVMLLLKNGWSLKAPDSEREFDQRAVCAGFSSIPPKFKLDVKPEQPVIKKSNALFDKCVENCDPAVMKEVSDNIDKMLGRQPEEGLEGKDFVEEVRQYYSNNCTWDALKQPMLSIITRCASHFAEWGADHLRDSTKMVPEGLEEAAEKHIQSVVDAAGHPGWDWETQDITDAFIAGAEWQKKRDDLETADLLAIAHLQGMEQQKDKMMEKAVEGVAEELYNDGEPQCTVGVGTYFKPGDKVYIIKED